MVIPLLYPMAFSLYFHSIQDIPSRQTCFPWFPSIIDVIDMNHETRLYPLFNYHQYQYPLLYIYIDRYHQQTLLSDPNPIFPTTALTWEEDVHLTDVCGISKAAVRARFVIATSPSKLEKARDFSHSEMVELENYDTILEHTGITGN